MRLAYVGSPELFSRGASSIHVMKMCQAISNLGLAVDLILPYFNSKEDIYSYYGIKPSFPIIKLKPSFDKSWPRHVTHGIVGSIYTAIAKKRYDMILTRNIICAYLSTKLFKIPTVFDAHHPPTNKLSLAMFKSFKDAPSLKRFATNSEGLGRIYLELGLSPEKHVVAHNGVDLECFTNLPDKATAIELLGLPVDKKIVCYSGNTYEGRGIELLIEASTRMDDVLFLVIGGLEVDNATYLRIAREKEANNFRLVGFVPHGLVPLYLAASDVLVIPYTSNMTIRGGTKASLFTSPIKLFEYMASCRPIVATSLPSISEIIRDGVNGILVEPDSLEALIKGIRIALNEREFAQTVARKAREDALKYTWEERAKKLLFDLQSLSS